MALNYPGPYEVRLFMTTDSLVHQMRLNVALSADPDIGETFDNILAYDRVATPRVLESQIDSLLAVLRPQFSAADTTFDYAELWKYEDLSFDAEYRGSHTIALAGTSGSSHEPASQLIFTFRTGEGGIMRVNCMEHASVNNARVPYASLGAVAKAIADEITDDESVWLARDTSFPKICIAGSFGQNEALFRRRFR